MLLTSRSRNRPKVIIFAQLLLQILKYIMAQIRHYTIVRWENFGYFQRKSHISLRSSYLHHILDCEPERDLVVRMI